MMNQFILLLAAVLACVSCAYACGGQILSQSFDKYTGGYQTWTKAMGKEDFDGLIFLKFDDFASVGDGHMRVMNPEGCVGTAGCGATFDVKLPPMDEATLSYKFKHSPGYVYGLGGKLPGLCAFDCPSGCVDVTQDSGFSARVMWRGEDLMSYSYYAGMTESNCGEDWPWGVTTGSGDWHTIEMYVKVNTDGQANGVQTIKYNGAEVYSANDILWSKTYHPIEKFTFRSFHGGGSEKWASAQDQYIYFDDIKISGGKCSGGGSTPTTPVSEPVSEPVAAPVAEPDAEPEAKQEPETTDPVPEDPVDPADATTTTDTGATTDAANCGTFMAPACTEGDPCREEGLTVSSGDQFLGENICRPGSGDAETETDTETDSGDAQPEPTTTTTAADEPTDDTPSEDGSGVLNSIQKEETFFEEDGAGAEAKQDTPATPATPAPVTQQEQSGSDSDDPVLDAGRCDPPPPDGFHCSSSNRHRKNKNRERKPKNRKL